MPAYKPKKTELTHEYFKKRPHLLPPTDNGGWDIATGSFVQCACYETFKVAAKRDSFVPWHLFLDGFTTAVEAGELDAGNWMRAFEDPEDWLLLAQDLSASEQRWLNERLRQALRHVLEGIVGDKLPSMLSGLGAIGFGLANHINWAAYRAAPVAGAPPRLRLV